MFVLHIYLLCPRIIEMKILLRLSFLLLICTSANTLFAGGCDVNASITPSGPTTFCSNDSIMLTANQGVSYQWSNGETTQSIWVNFPGPYSVAVTDSDGCTDNSGPTFITVLPAPDATILADQLPPYCMGDEVTLFTINVFADHEWSTGETGSSITITQSGLYEVVVNNFFGCSDTGFFPVAFLPTPFLSVTANGPTTFCEGDDVKLSVNFGFGLSFEWSPNGETTSSITVTESGTYNVTATSNLIGCSTTSQDFEVNVVPIPEAQAFGDTLICTPDTLTLTASGGNNYSWTDGLIGSEISVYPETGSNQYIVTVSNAGCNITDKDTVFVQVGGDVVAAFSVDPQPLGDETVFTDLTTGSVTEWNWDLGNGEFSDVQNPTNIYLDEDSFTVVLISADQFGCSDTAQQSFAIQQVVTIPNVFTPNDDGYNDIFYIRNAGDGGFIFTVSNRWGQVVYASEGKEVRWNGRSNSGAELQAGTYFYILTIDLKAGEEPVIEKGYITLIKS